MIAVAAPATCVVIVPVLGRPHNVAPLVESLRSSTDDARLVFVVDADDDLEIDAIEAAGADMIVNRGESKTFATKANLGYGQTTEPWLLFVGDDVQFHPGWLDAALAAAGDRFHLVATNDMRNAAVMAGMHATHPMMRRSWIDTHGASWDGPGTVAHEGYRHWYVDNEWTTVARRAGVFTYAPNARVEHQHPIWGDVYWDATYLLGQVHAEDDQRLFVSRLADAR